MSTVKAKKPMHHVEMFTSSDFTSADPVVWGYQCFTCHQEESSFATMALAEAAAVEHQLEAAAS